MKKLNKILSKIFSVLSTSQKISFADCLVKINNSQIITPVGDISQILFKNRSRSREFLVDLHQLKKLIISLDRDNSIVRLNHIGFGYKVDSLDDERKKLTKIVSQTNKFLYEEESNDFALWLFLGDLSTWDKPLIEFVPVEKDLPEADYFLPHIQIDIDTTLNESEIEDKIKNFFNNRIKPFRIVVINEVTYIVRSRLGVIDGVNIFLDLATKSRNVKYHRKNLLKKIPNLNFEVDV